MAGTALPTPEVPLILVFTLLSASLAHAAPADVQLRVYPSTFDFAERQLEDLDPLLTDDDLSFDDIDCYDRLGVRDFNLDVPIDDVALSVGPGTLSVHVALGTVWGEDMVVYGLDEDYLDTCAEFEGDLEYLTLVDGTLDAVLGVEAAADGSLLFSWVEEPVVSGDLDMDINWVPDDLVLWFIEDTLFQAVGDSLGEALPPMLDALTGEPLLDGDYGDYSVLLDLTDVDLDAAALSLGVSADVDYLGDVTCEVDAAGLSASGQAASLPLTDPGEADLGVGLTEAFIDQLLFMGWRAGFFCEQSETFEELVEDLHALLATDAVDVQAWSSLDAPPQLLLGQDGGALTLDGLHLDVTADGDPIIQATMDVSGTTGLGLSPSGTSLVMGMTDLRIVFTDIDLSGFKPGVDAWVKSLVEAWVAREVEAELQQIPVFDAAYRGHGLVARVTQVQPQDDGVEVFLRLYDEDDPDVDSVPPDTSAEVVRASGDSVEIAWSGTDDGGGALAFTAQVDGTGWIDWSEEPGTDFNDLIEGDHVIEVKSRDTWMNEDPTPASLTVTVSGDQPAALPEECGCATARPDAWAWLAGLLAALVLRRRRG